MEDICGSDGLRGELFGRDVLKGYAEFDELGTLPPNCGIGINADETFPHGVVEPSTERSGSRL
jgi:hypothetical protein